MCLPDLCKVHMLWTYGEFPSIHKASVLPALLEAIYESAVCFFAYIINILFLCQTLTYIKYLVFWMQSWFKPRYNQSRLWKAFHPSGYACADTFPLLDIVFCLYFFALYRVFLPHMTLNLQHNMVIMLVYIVCDFQFTVHAAPRYAYCQSRPPSVDERVGDPHAQWPWRVSCLALY